MNKPPDDQHEHIQDEEEIGSEEHELTLLSQLPHTLRDYRAQALAEGLVLKFHVFCDRTDDFTTEFPDAMALYWQHRYEGQPNVRLYLELQDRETGQEQDEDCLLSFGDFPDERAVVVRTAQKGVRQRTRLSGANRL